MTGHAITKQWNVQGETPKLAFWGEKFGRVSVLVSQSTTLSYRYIQSCLFCNLINTTRYRYYAKQISQPFTRRQQWISFIRFSAPVSVWLLKHRSCVYLCVITTENWILEYFSALLNWVTCLENFVNVSKLSCVVSLQ